jgi:Calcium binding
MAVAGGRWACRCAAQWEAGYGKSGRICRRNGRRACCSAFTASTQACAVDMLVLVSWQSRNLAATLSQLAATDADESTIEAIGDSGAMRRTTTVSPFLSGDTTLDAMKAKAFTPGRDSETVTLSYPVMPFSLSS